MLELIQSTGYTYTDIPNSNKVVLERKFPNAKVIIEFKATTPEPEGDVYIMGLSLVLCLNRNQSHQRKTMMVHSRIILIPNRRRRGRGNCNYHHFLLILQSL